MSDILYAFRGCAGVDLAEADGEGPVFTCGLAGRESCRTCTLPLNCDCLRVWTYRSIDASSSQAFLELKDVHGSEDETLIVGVTDAGGLGVCSFGGDIATDSGSGTGSGSG